MVSREDLLAYRRIAYRPADMIVAAAGRVRHQEVVDLVAASFEGFVNGAPGRERQAVTTHPGVYALSRDLEQVNLVLGARDWRRAIPGATPPPCSSWSWAAT